MPRIDFVHIIPQTSNGGGIVLRFQTGLFLFFSSSNYTGSGTPTTFFTQRGHYDPFTRVGSGKLGREADRLLPSNARVRMHGAIPTYTHTHTHTHTHTNNHTQHSHSLSYTHSHSHTHTHSHTTLTFTHTYSRTHTHTHTHS